MRITSTFERKEFMQYIFKPVLPPFELFIDKAKLAGWRGEISTFFDLHVYVRDSKYVVAYIDVK